MQRGLEHIHYYGYAPGQAVTSQALVASRFPLIGVPCNTPTPPTEARLGSPGPSSQPSI